MTVHARVAVIGAGVVGLAIAERLSRRMDGIVVLEAAARPGQATSSRNSAVLHAGLYYPPGSLKARLCVAGNASLAAWCASHGVRLLRRGKLIVAGAEDERPELERLLRQGRENGVTLEAVERDFIANREPNVRAVAGVWSPSTGVLDVHALIGSLEAVARDRGVTIATHHRVVGLSAPGGGLGATFPLSAGGAGRGAGAPPETKGLEEFVAAPLASSRGGWRVAVVDPSGEEFTLEADLVVNAAGLHADAVCELAGLDVDALGLRQHWVKGRYVRVRPRRPLHHLLYPVPAPRLVGLGVHVTIDVDGEVRLGPDVLPLDARREDYAIDDECLPRFLEAGRRLLPWLEADDLTVDQAGLRPRLSPADGPWRDFSVTRPLDGFITLAGIESPGLTCALELAGLVDELVGQSLSAHQMVG